MDYLTRDDVELVVDAAVKKTLLSMGVDPNNPIEMQRDFQALRDWRRAGEAMRSRGFLTLVGVFVAGVMGILWLGVQSVLKS